MCPTKLLLKSFVDRLVHSVVSTTLTKNGDGIRFCPPGFSCQKGAKIGTPVWLWRQEVLLQDVQSVSCC